jgi:hypothetical protein
MSNFLQVQGNQGIARRRTFVRRTINAAPTCHVFSVIDAEFAEKGHLWTETDSIAIITHRAVAVSYIVF